MKTKSPYLFYSGTYLARTLAKFSLSIGLFLLMPKVSLAVLGACGDRHLPEDRIRKLNPSSIRLSCTSASDSFVRGPKAWNYKTWAEQERLALNASSDGNEDAALRARSEMQKVAQSPETEVRWGGVLSYETLESWDWVDWVYGPDRAACGVDVSYNEVCTTTPASTSCSTDAEGNQDCSTTPASTSCSTHRVETVRSCWHDEPKHESRHCSNEVVRYSAQFVRPTPESWGPGKSQDYLDILPNKYDLLPGEIETIQVSSNSGQSETLNPSVNFGDAWNDYQAELEFAQGGGSRVACRFNQTYDLSVSIHTLKRKLKKSPNAFRLPLNPETKEPMDPLRWTEDHRSVQIRPNLLRLQDSSAEIITAMARQSRNFDGGVSSPPKTNIEEVTNSQTLEAQTNTEGFKGFWKDTQVRVRLVEVRPLLYRDSKVTEKIFVSGADVEIEGALYWIPLEGVQDQQNLYRSKGPFFSSIWNLFEYRLRPGKKYRMYVSMYQKGVPFYTKACGEEGSSGGVKCALLGENAYFSKELPIEFVTDKNNDVRGLLQVLSDFQGTPFLLKPVEFWRILRRIF